MRILVDAVQDTDAVSGSDRFTRNVLRRLPELLPSATWLVAVRSRNGFIASPLAETSRMTIIEPPAARNRRVWLLGVMPALAYGWRPDVTLGMFNCVLPPVGPGKSICTVYDLIPFRLQETYYPGRLKRFATQSVMRRSLSRADAIATPSQTTMSDLTAFLGHRPRRGVVATAAIDPEFRPQDPEVVSELIQRLGLPERFVLTMGSREPRKNLKAAIDAHRLLDPEMRAQVPLVVAGAHWKSVDQVGVADPFVRELGFVEESDLPALYAAASLFLFLSVYEGFGLPPLEALACGTQVVSSNRTSLPEVMGDAALLVDPSDVTAVAAAVEFALTRAPDAARLQRGFAQAARFSYDDSASSYAGLIEELAWS